MIIEIKLKTNDNVKIVKMLNKLNLEQSQNQYDLLSYTIDGKDQLQSNE